MSANPEHIIRNLARKLLWWASYVNDTGTNEDAIADSANDAGYAVSVLRGIGFSEGDIQKLWRRYT